MTIANVLMADYPLLSTLLMLLPVGAAITLVLPARLSRWAALATSITALVMSLVIIASFDTTYTGFQFVEKKDWITSLNIHYMLGVDGFSVLFIAFTCLLFIGVILSSWNAIRILPSLYFALVLVLEGAIIGIFSALDTILFMLFWELTLIPLFFLIGLWGSGPNRRYAGVKYTLFMITGGLPLTIGFIVLAAQGQNELVFSYPELLGLAHEHPMQTIVFFLLLFGFAFKVPLFPVHTWLPIVAQEGPTGIIAILTGLKVGAYAMLRFVVPLAPEAAQDFQWLLVSLGMLSLLYGAITALGQTNLRRLLAYSSLSHVGLVILGIATFNQQGLEGAVFQLLNFALISGGLFIIVGFLHQRIGSTEILSLGGVAKSMPLLSAFFFFLGMASIGIPGTSGFPAEFLMIVGVLEVHTGAGLVALFVAILGAAYLLNAYREAFLGSTHSEAVADSPDLKARELLILGVLSLLVLVFGFYPQVLLNIMETTSIGWGEFVTLSPTK